MAFLNRLFNRKSKTEFVSGAQQASLRRSLTDPQQSTSSPARGRKSSSDDRDTLDMLPGPRVVAPVRIRRAGCDFSRSKTSVDVSSVRSSSSSAAEPASSSADGSKSQYRQLRALHRSRLHTIMAAQDRSSKRPVVLKAFLKSRLTSSLRAKLEAEVHHLRALSGVPGVVQYISQFEDDDSIYLVMDRCPGPTLIELIANSGGRLPEHVLVPDVLIPLTLTLMDLHRRGIVHRQLKPEHTLCQVEAGAVTLLDFSEAVNKNQRCLNNRAGSLEYMAPEVINKPTAEEVFHQVLCTGLSEEELPQYDEKADVWSLGVLAFEALTGCQPFLADTPADMGRLQRELLQEADAGGWPRLFADRPQLSAEARSFLLQTLQLDPINRSSAERLLQHPLIQRYWAKYQAKQVAVPLAAACAPAPPNAVPAAAPAPVGQTGGSVCQGAAHAVGLSVGNGQAAVAAAATAAAASAAAGVAASRTGSVGGPSGCAMPVAAQKAGLLVTAPLQFTVR